VSPFVPSPEARLEFTLYLLPENSSHPLPGEHIEAVLAEWDQNTLRFEGVSFQGRVESAQVYMAPEGFRTIEIRAVGTAQYEIGVESDGPTYPRFDSELHFEISATAHDRDFVAYVPEAVYGVRPSDPVWVPTEAFLAPSPTYRCRREVLIGADWPIHIRLWTTWEPFGSDFVLNWSTHRDGRRG
jgi:hypothetical protein